ncbi:MAG: gliding motility-associated C-terminal domain-containing protein [Bacteroidetes bacterium]|nr:gliding motility-associated C-terminal domain-containing protein [Bacteroidota bacterium]
MNKSITTYFACIRRLFTVAFLVLFITKESSSQKHKNIWYFGNGAGIDFSQGQVIPLVNGELYTNEGCAVATNRYGKLLFYTDGRKVYDQTNKQMPNGVDLAGGYSSTQSAVIIQKPGDNKTFYIFTIDEQGEASGLNYSMVNMNLNYGRGDVTIKNQQLIAPTTEKLVAINHCNGKDVWIVTHQWNSNHFYSYLVTEFGIKAPVISKVGLVHKDYGSGNNSESIGMLVASYNGTRLACAINKLKNNNVELFNFNPSSGQITNPVPISVQGTAYGVCFSPNNTKLYVSVDAEPSFVYQLDLSAKVISSSAIAVSVNKKQRHSSMQLGPDGKIYIATGNTYLDVIESPNSRGIACKYRHAKIDLSNRHCTFGLPSFVENYNNEYKLNLGRDTTVCTNIYFLESNIKADNYQWSNGENGEAIAVKKSGIYWLKTTHGSCSQIDSIKILLTKPSSLKLDLGNDTSLCDTSLMLYSGIKAKDYTWSTGAKGPELKAMKSGKYWLRISDNNCHVTDTIELKLKGKPIFIPATDFIPKNNGFNEIFDYIIDNIDYFDLKITNASGKTVFKSKDPIIKWDGTVKGKVAPAGIYYWTLKYKSNCLGKTTYSKKGEVKLLRFSGYN